MRRTATAAILLAMLAGACEPSPEGSEGTRWAAGANADAQHVVVDTDLAFDDIMALLYLLQRDDVVIDAVTIAGTGEAHCDPGVRNAIRLLALGGETDAPVACGRETPLQGTNAFPGAGWIDRWDEGAPLRFATTVPDPLAFERVYLSVLTGETIPEVRPDPTMTISFDGKRCAIQPRRLSARTGRRVRRRARARNGGRDPAPAQRGLHLRGSPRSRRPGRLDSAWAHPTTQGPRGARVRRTTGGSDDDPVGHRGVAHEPR